MPADFTRLIPGDLAAVTVVDDLRIKVEPEGGMALRVPVLVIDPLSRSAWVVV